MEKKFNTKPMTRHKAGEDYLEAILVLTNSKGFVRSIDVANLLEFSKPSVSRAVSVLKEAGYITVDENHYLFLTDTGRKIAEEIFERHRFFTEFLTAIGVDPNTAEEDACQMEHVVSAESFERLKEFWNKLDHENCPES